MATQHVWPKPGVVVPNEYAANTPYPSIGWDVPLPFSRSVTRALNAGDLVTVDPGGTQPETDPTQNLQTGTTLTLTAAMNGRDTKLTNPSGCAVTVPSTLPVGTKYPIFVMASAGQATFTGSGGMVVYPPKGLLTKSFTGGSGIGRLTIEIVSGTECVLSGDVAAT